MTQGIHIVAAALLAVSLVACGRAGATGSATVDAAPQPRNAAPSSSGSSLQTAGPQVARPDSGSHAVPAASANRAAELHVDSYETATSFEGTPAPHRHAFVVVNIRWKNILPSQEVSDDDQPADPTQGAGGLGSGGASSKKAGSGKMHTVFVPYVIPNVTDHLHLIVNGEAGATLVNDNFKSKDLLSPALQKIVHGADVAGRYVFDARAPITSLELDYFDNIYGNIKIPIAGSAPAAARGAVAGPMTSGGLVSSITDVQEVAALGDRKARTGARLVVVSILGQGAASVGDNFLEVKPTEIARLIENSGYMYTAADVQDVEGVWNDTVRFVPGSPSRGKLVFEVPAQHAPLALSIMVPGEAKPVRLPLSAAAATPSPKPSAIATVPDGATGAFYLYASRRAKTYGDQTADTGQEFLVLDVGLENRTDSGMEFQTKEQIELLNGSEEISATDDDLAAAPRALPESGVVPAHTLGRYEIPFRVPAGAQKLVVYYRGFENEKKFPLGGGQ